MTSYTRRDFLQSAACAATGLVAGRALGQSKPADIDLPRPCAPTAWHKHGTILEGNEPWEGGSVQNFTCPAEPLGNDHWRFWYSGIGKKYQIAYAEGVPGGPMKKFPAQCTPGRPVDAPFAIGNLPEGWNPVQVVHIHLRSGRHRIYFWVHGPGMIIRYLAAESDDGRRYTVIDPLRPVLYHLSDRATYGASTPDGVKSMRREAASPPGEPSAPSRLISNDATTVYQLADGSFEMYSVALLQVPKSDPAYIAHDNAPGFLRVVDRYTSEDGLHFETRHRVIARDAADPVDQQFYYLSMTSTDRGRVGMLGHYRVQAQTMDLEWCFSPDGRTWRRPLRTAWLPRGKKGEPDCYGIYSGSSLVRHGGKWHLFYTGVNEAHNHKDTCAAPARAVVMHATTESIWTSAATHQP